MSITEQIQHKAEVLPESLQKEILHFTEFLSLRMREATIVKEKTDWYNLSLKSVLQGMENEDTSSYEHITFKEKWQ
ncbi:MAG: DUF2281 domain-containing protein [Bacteroidota bacterium]